MKKSALLAVSALSLGVVGLASLGVGVNDEDGTEQNLDVTIPAMTGNDMKFQKTTISTTNNTGNEATLSVKDFNETTALTSGLNTIPTIGAEGALSAGTSAWGISVNNDDTYVAMPASTESALPIGSDGAATAKDFNVTYGVSTSATQATGTYTDQIVYSFTES